jgi:hypothetical protein
MKSYALYGIETDNLLGFLALLGLLRSIGLVRPNWFPRAYYAGTPFLAHLQLAVDALPEEISEAASVGCLELASHFSFGNYHDLTFSGDEARNLMQHSLADAASAQVMSAMFSDVAVRPKDGRIEPTALCAMFGQGHQSFLDRLHSVSAGTLPGKLKNAKQALDLNDPAIIGQALFSPWTRSDKTESFRWDFEEDRRYALRFVDPSGDAPTTEHGANRLAIAGLLSLQSAPIVRRNTVHLATRAVSRHSPNWRPLITWPIWTQPATLPAIHGMLDDPELAKSDPSFSKLRRHGIVQARRVTRYSAGKFLCFSRAEALG